MTQLYDPHRYSSSMTVQEVSEPMTHREAIELSGTAA